MEDSNKDEGVRSSQHKRSGQSQTKKQWKTEILSEHQGGRNVKYERLKKTKDKGTGKKNVRNIKLEAIF